MKRAKPLSDYEKTTTPNMVVDKTTGAVLNTDMGAYAAIKAARAEKRKQFQLIDRVNKLEIEVAELKAMMMKQTNE